MMTTREEYAEAADHAESLAMLRAGHFSDMHRLAARVLRQLADGAVLCREGQTTYIGYSPIEEQP